MNGDPGVGHLAALTVPWLPAGRAVVAATGTATQAEPTGFVGLTSALLVLARSQVLLFSSLGLLSQGILGPICL